MKTTIIFDTITTGHHSEYIRHLYSGAVKDSASKYVFVLPEEFRKNNTMADEHKRNIVWDFFTTEEQKCCNNCNLILGAYRKSRLVKRYVKRYYASDIVFIMLMHMMPFVAWIISRKVRITGIIYRIYLYDWRGLNFKQKIINVLKFWSLAHSKNIYKPCILNDDAATAYLNRIYHTSKFHELPDPFPEINYKAKNIRKELGITDDQKMFLHFGALDPRKGTIDILNSLDYLTEEERRKYVFVFAGRVHDSFKSVFYTRLNVLKDKFHIIVKDEFVPSDTLNDLCYSSDVILIPYHNTSQSSGVIGYASMYGKPVLGPGEGLLGKIIRKNRLGLSIYGLDAKKLAKAYITDLPNPPKKYVEKNQISNFINELLN